MTFKEAEALVFGQLPAFSQQGKKALKYDFENITQLCAFFGNPEKKIPFIHVAGTNGKGSTCHILAATFTQAGYKTGLYTSPHLNNIRERCRIDGQMISEERFVDFVSKISPLLSSLQPSYFELNVALAFYAFEQEQVDIAIIETGLGGRLDSTNIILPELAVITQIALDHTDILGDTLEKIAAEKAGIIKPKTPVVIGKTQAETEKVFTDKALALQAPIVFADQLFSLVKTNTHNSLNTFHCVRHYDQAVFKIETDLQGSFQAYNITTALAAVSVMAQIGWKVSMDNVLQALPRIQSLSGLKGRWDFYRPNIILDVAHNPDGILQVVQNLKPEMGKLKIVFGAVKDKDVRASVKLLPKTAHYFLCQAQIPRAKPVSELATIFEEQGLSFEIHPQVATAVNIATTVLQENETVLIIGSFFIVGEAYSYLEEHLPRIKK